MWGGCGGGFKGGKGKQWVRGDIIGGGGVGGGVLPGDAVERSRPVGVWVEYLADERGKRELGRDHQRLRLEPGCTKKKGYTHRIDEKTF